MESVESRGDEQQNASPCSDSFDNTLSTTAQLEESGGYGFEDDSLEGKQPNQPWELVHSKDVMANSDQDTEREYSRLRQESRELSRQLASADEQLARFQRQSAALGKENKELASKVKLSSTRLRRAMQLGGARSAAMAFELLRVCPFLDAASAYQFGACIDMFEDFDHPEKLNVTRSGDRLDIVYWSGPAVHDTVWEVIYPVAKLSAQQQNSLCGALEAQITKQKELFPIRATVKRIYEKHLSRVPRTGHSSKVLTADKLHAHLQAASNPREVAEGFQRQLVSGLEVCFREFELNRLDVESLLFDSWQPLEMLRAMWTHAYLVQYSHKQFINEPEPAVGSETQKAEMVSLWEMFKEMRAREGTRS